VIGYCVGYSYGQLMAGAHYHVKKAAWAASIHVQFLEPVESAISQDELVIEAEKALAACRFYQRDCDLRVWGHRFGDSLASVVSGSLIAALVCLGSTCGSWVAVTAAAIADPKPVTGCTSAAWLRGDILRDGGHTWKPGQIR
jgi:hypothetical protein